MTRAILAGLLFLSLLSPTTATYGNRCSTDPHADPTVVAILCSNQSDNSSAYARHQVEAADVSPRYDYLWLPTCPGALPSSKLGVSEMDCPSAHRCTDSQQMSMSLYGRPLTAKSGWEYLGSECRDPAEAGAVPAQRRVLRTSDVISAIRRIGVPDAGVEGPAYTLVNLETTFFCKPPTLDRTLAIIGYNVDVQVEPSSYTWRWGDGSTSTSQTPGHPYPSKDVTHTYTDASDKGQPLRLSVDVSYSARYRVDGGAWREIPDTLTIPGSSRDLPIKQAAAVLISND